MADIGEETQFHVVKLVFLLCLLLYLQQFVFLRGIMFYVCADEHDYAGK